MSLIRATFTSSNADIPSRDIGYVYDKVGNRVREIVNGATKDYGVTAMNQYSQAGTFSYTYDPDGNLTGKTNGTDTWTYVYNDDNRLIRSSGPDGEKEYIYNGLGHLAAVIADGVRHDYTIDPFGLGNVMAEYDTAGNLASRYTHGLGLVAKDDNFYTFDGNGNTSEMTNAANEIVNFYLYEPFGKTLYDVETTDNDFQFVGQLGVRQMGDDLVYMRNRFFMPSLGRFFSEDPIGLAGGDVSFYRYVQNDPVNWVDPWGLSSYGFFSSAMHASPTLAGEVKGFEAAASEALQNSFDAAETASPYVAAAAAAVATGGLAGELGPAATAAYYRYGPPIAKAGDWANKAAQDYWGTGQPGWFALKDKLQGYWEDLKDWLKDKDPCETN
jgi:RHS repeat-associated protein